MKIVFLNPSGQLGGAERVLLDVLACLRKNRPEWKLHLISSDEGPLLGEANLLRVGTHICRFPVTLARIGDAQVAYKHHGTKLHFWLLARLLLVGPSVYWYLRRLRKLIAELGPDVIHTNGMKMHILGALSQAGPVVWHIHDFISSRPVSARLLRRYSSGCKAVIAISGSVVQDVLSSCGNGTKVYQVYNAVDLDRFSPDGNYADLDRLSGLAPAKAGTVRVGLIATFGLWKGHEVFLKAISRIPRDLPFRAYVIGGPLYQTDGSQWDLKTLRSLAKSLGIDNLVGFTGFIDHPATAIRSLDVVVHASTQPEPFGLIIAEAMACGRAVIVSESGGAAEIIVDGENALSHPPGNSEILADRIAQLIRAPELRAKLGIAGRATAERMFDRARLAQELIPIYEDVALKTHARATRL